MLNASNPYFLKGEKVPFGYYTGKGDCWVRKLQQGSLMRVKQLQQGSLMQVKQPQVTNSPAGVVAMLDLWPITNPPGICAPGILLRRSVGNEPCIFTIN